MNIDEASYGYLLKTFSSEKIEQRYDFLKSLMMAYIDREKLEDQVFIERHLLEHVLLDYFADIQRLKEFHNIGKINADKITAYSIYWILRRKPLQVKNNTDTDVSFVNERFVVSYLQSVLFDEDQTILISPQRKLDHDNFFRTFLYAAKYREMTPQMMELMIIAYRAGRALQYSVDVAQQQNEPNLCEEELDLT